MENLERLAAALAATPTAAYSAPHDYPNAARMFQRRPMAERPQVASEHLRLYVHIPFCNYACSFCCYAKKRRGKHCAEAALCGRRWSVNSNG